MFQLRTSSISFALNFYFFFCWNTPRTPLPRPKKLNIFVSTSKSESEKIQNYQIFFQSTKPTRRKNLGNKIKVSSKRKLNILRIRPGRKEIMRVGLFSSKRSLLHAPTSTNRVWANKEKKVCLRVQVTSEKN